MARIRTIKPEFFLHEDLHDLEVETELPVRLSFIGLWCVADREGRFQWRPRTLKASVLPFEEIDFSRVLDALTSRGFIVKYVSETGEQFGCIPSFLKHQVINNREKASILPDINDCEIIDTFQDVDACLTRERRVVEVVEGKGKEGKGKEGKESCPSNDERLEGFNLFWSAFNYKEGKKPAFESWKKIKGYNQDLLQIILAGAEREAMRRPSLIAKGKTPKMAQGWITECRWEDEHEEQQKVHSGPTEAEKEFIRKHYPNCANGMV